MSPPVLKMPSLDDAKLGKPVELGPEPPTPTTLQRRPNLRLDPSPGAVQVYGPDHDDTSDSSDGEFEYGSSTVNRGEGFEPPSYPATIEATVVTETHRQSPIDMDAVVEATIHYKEPIRSVSRKRFACYASVTILVILGLVAGLVISNSRKDSGSSNLLPDNGDALAPESTSSDTVGPTASPVATTAPTSLRGGGSTTTNKPASSETAVPTTPTLAPVTPSLAPVVAVPANSPTMAPVSTSFPTREPTGLPTAVPTVVVAQPTFLEDEETDKPTVIETHQPVQRETEEPTVWETYEPTEEETNEPTEEETFEPTEEETNEPTEEETNEPTEEETNEPTEEETEEFVLDELDGEEEVWDEEEDLGWLDEWVDEIP